VDVEDGLFEIPCEDIPGKTDSLLGSDEGMYVVVY